MAMAIPWAILFLLPSIYGNLYDQKLVINKYNKIEDALDLIKEGEFYINVDSNKDAILVVGNTGSGKSTLTQFMAGDNSKLRAVENGEDTGEFLIEDDNNRIGSGIYSKTVIPEKVIDKDTGIAYYDCPGFSDTRNTAFDIASTYFTKRIIDNVRNVKIVFTISYPSLKKGVDRTDFMKLLRHGQEFIKDLHKFNNSIVLIATKVNNDYVRRNKDFILVSDDKIIDNIGKYIEEVREALLQRFQADNDPVVLNYLKLTDIFLSKDNGGGYNRIGLFRRPDQPGVLSEVQLLQNGKGYIKNVIEDNMSYTTKDNDDFGFTVSDNSKNNIYKLVDKINRDIEIAVSNTTEDIEQSYNYELMSSGDNIYEVKNVALRSYNDLHKTLKELEQSENFREFIVKFIDYINGIDVKNSKKVFTDILEKYNLINFLQLVADQKYKSKPLEWSRPLYQVEDSLQHKKYWHSFLVDLHDKSSIYKNYNHVRNNLLKNRSKRNIVNDYNTGEVLEVVENFDVDFYNKVKDLPVDLKRQRELRTIVDVILKESTFECKNRNELEARGTYIKLSDVLTVAHHRNVCMQSLKSLKVFALDTVFIDADFEAAGEFSMYIVAPRWEVVGTRKIKLVGKDANEHSSRKAHLAKDGMPGLPGGSAGNFIGIGKEFVNGDMLSIMTKGGNGGPGQNGGDGIPGQNGYSELPYGSKSNGEYIMSKSGYKHLWTHSHIAKNKFWHWPAFLLFINEKITADRYLMFGKKGEKGGRGARGGRGGNGGSGGNIVMLALDGDCKVHTSMTMGGKGSDGAGGKGGPGGKNDYDYEVEHTTEDVRWFRGVVDRDSKGWYVVSKTSKYNAPSGDENYEKNHAGLQTPKQIQHEPLFKIINSFDQLLFENLANPFKNNLVEFYFDLANNSNIQQTYDSFALLKELQILEEHSLQFSHDPNYVHFYKSLLERVSSYSRNVKPYEQSEINKKLINYLYTATLSKIVSLTDKSTGNVVINIEDYFAMLQNNFKNIQRHINDLVKKEYNINYKKKIDFRINDAQNLIDTQVVPEIEKIIDENDNSIDILIEELVQMQKDGYNTREKLLEKQKELIKEIEKSNNVDYMIIIGSLIKIIGPIGSSINEAIHIASSWLSKNNDHETGESISGDVVRIINNAYNVIERFTQMPAVATDHYLSQMSTELQKDPEHFKDIITNLFDIKNTLELNGDDMHLEQVDNLIKGLKQTVEEQIEMDRLNNNTSTDNNIVRLKNFLSASSNLVNLSVKLFMKNKDNEEKLQAVNKAIVDVDLDMSFHGKQQKVIYDHLIPLIKQIEKVIMDYKAEVVNKNLAGLNVARWKIHSTIKDMKLVLKKFTTGYNIQEDLLYFSDKLLESMNTLNNVYERIQYYNEQKELSDYIVGLNTNQHTDLKVHNKTIYEALNQLDLIMRSNVVLDQFDAAISSFKQFTFPFADYYFEDSIVLSHSVQEKNLENLISIASHEVENFKHKLMQKRLLLHNSIDENIYEERFKSADRLSGPFFKWTNEKFKKPITDFLSGKEIILKADVLSSDLNKNAVKFNNIALNLRHVHSADDYVLYEKLKDFDINMKHFGNSYYRCGTKFYVIDSGSQSIYYSFEEKNGEPRRKNEIYKKITNAQFILSPYATWSFQLKSPLNVSFTELDEFVGNVDLELEGYGQYVLDREDNICNRNLKKHYNVDDTISVTDTIDFVPIS